MLKGFMHWQMCWLAIVCALFLAACSSHLRIIDQPIPFSPQRIQMTRDYIEQHYGLVVSDIAITPRIIVLHWTAIGDFAGSYRAFTPELLPSSRPELRSPGEVNVSIQFLVDKDGKAYRLMPETWMARHCIGLNYESLGVENVGGEAGVDNLTKAQLAANVRLVRDLVKKYPSIAYLIGHHEYQAFEGHSLWREKDESYRTTKTDPGERFMRAVRAAVRELHLKGVKEIVEERRR